MQDQLIRLNATSSLQVLQDLGRFTHLRSYDLASIFSDLKLQLCIAYNSSNPKAIYDKMNTIHLFSDILQIKHQAQYSPCNIGFDDLKGFGCIHQHEICITRPVPYPLGNSISQDTSRLIDLSHHLMIKLSVFNYKPHTYQNLPDIIHEFLQIISCIYTTHQIMSEKKNNIYFEGNITKIQQLYCLTQKINT